MAVHYAEFVTCTPDPEAFMAYVARVSAPGNQDNPDYIKLLKYCIKNKHMSVFESSYLTMKFVTTLDIATQVLRHRSFTFQQLSRRYAGDDDAPVEIIVPNLRAPHPKNRQKSMDTLDEKIKHSWTSMLESHFEQSKRVYKMMLADGVAKECARCVLPQSTVTSLYVTGNARSFMTYIALRQAEGSQEEHRELVLSVKKIFAQTFPTCNEALEELEWKI